MSASLSPEQKLLFEAGERVLRGEDQQDVVRDLGLAVAAINREVDDLIEPDALKSLLEQMAVDYGLVGRKEFPFVLGVGSKTYTPDCVWFEGTTEPEAAVAIFEIEVGTSPQHRAGGVALANFVALSGPKPLRFFAITRGRHQTVMANTVELFAKLQDKWRLDAVVIPSFSPAVIRERVQVAFGGQASAPSPGRGA